MKDMESGGGILFNSTIAGVEVGRDCSTLGYTTWRL